MDDESSVDALSNDIRTLAFAKESFESLFGKLSSEQTGPAEYIYHYLEDGGLKGDLETCKWIVVEETYYSREYRAEFLSYYSSCFIRVSPYAKRVHFFGELQNDIAETLDEALLGDSTSIEDLQVHYLGSWSSDQCETRRSGRPFLSPMIQGRHLAGS